MLHLLHDQYINCMVNCSLPQVQTIFGMIKYQASHKDVSHKIEIGEPPPDLVLPASTCIPTACTAVEHADAGGTQEEEVVP